MTVDLIRWRLVGGTWDPWRALRPAPRENRGFTERGSYEFEKPGPGWVLRIDDEPLADAAPGAWGWLWEPGFYAGEVTAELLAPDRGSSRLFLLDVAPDPGKLGRDVFCAMLGEIWKEDPGLIIGSEPATKQIGELGTSENTWLAFARFRRYVPDFLRATRAVRARPRHALRVSRISTPLHHARRVDRQTATALARSSAIGLLSGSSDAVSVFTPEARLDVPFIDETLDSAANRAMLALLLALIRRATTLLSRLEAAVAKEPQSETRTLLARRWPSRKENLNTLAQSLKRLLRQSPFADVQRPELTAAGLTAVAADPTYARCWQRGWRALRGGLEGEGANERLWISPSWEVYERWCFVRLGRLLSVAAPEWQWTRRGERWVGRHGGRRAELTLQPTFRSRDGQVAGRWSISKERVPDLVLEVESNGAIRFVVLDAKYRASRANVLDAMESAHIYRDSLRVGPRRPDAALLLVPAGGGASWLEEPAFQAEHGVGVHVLSPDAGPAIPHPVLSALQD